MNRNETTPHLKRFSIRVLNSKLQEVDLTGNKNFASAPSNRPLHQLSATPTVRNIICPQHHLSATLTVRNSNVRYNSPSANSTIRSSNNPFLQHSATNYPLHQPVRYINPSSYLKTASSSPEKNLAPSFIIEAKPGARGTWRAILSLLGGLDLQKIVLPMCSGNYCTPQQFHK